MDNVIIFPTPKERIWRNRKETIEALLKSCYLPEEIIEQVMSEFEEYHDSIFRKFESKFTIAKELFSDSQHEAIARSQNISARDLLQKIAKYQADMAHLILGLLSKYFLLEESIQKE